MRLGPPALYLVVAALFLMPALAHPASTVIGGGANGQDVWAHLWWLWWFREALLHGHTPYATALLYHPFGASLYLMGMDQVTALLGVPLQGAIGLVATYNLLLLLATAFSAYGMYLLALDVTGSRGGALVAGALFGFAPLQSSFVNEGQLELASLGFVPLAILFLLRLRRDGRPRTVAVGAICLAFAALTSWYQALMLALFAALFAAYEVAGLLRGRRWPDARAFAARLGACGGLALVLVAPILVPLVREARAAGYALVSWDWFADTSLNLVEPLLPNGLNPLFGPQRAVISHAIGYTALALALLGFRRAQPGRRFWALAAGVFFLLALGPYLNVFDARVDLPLLPYNLLYALPFAGIARAPVRFMVVVTLALAIFAARGVARLGERLARRWPRRATAARRGAAACALLLVLGELLPAPRPLAGVAQDPFYATLRGGPPGAVLELPYDVVSDGMGLPMYRQTLHDRPLVGGYTSRQAPYPLADVPVLGQLAMRRDLDFATLTRPDIVDQPAPLERSVELFDAYDIRYVVFRKDYPARQVALPMDAALRRALPASAVVWDDAALRAYLIPHTAASGVVVGFGPGWADPAPGADGRLCRQTAGDAAMNLTLLDPAPRTAHFTATIAGRGETTGMDVVLNGRVLATLAVGATPQAVALDLPLAHGYNALAFRPRAASAPGGVTLATVRVAVP